MRKLARLLAVAAALILVIWVARFLWCRLAIARAGGTVAFVVREFESAQAIDFTVYSGDHIRVNRNSAKFGRILKCIKRGHVRASGGRQDRDRFLQVGAELKAWDRIRLMHANGRSTEVEVERGIERDRPGNIVIGDVVTLKPRLCSVSVFVPRSLDRKASELGDALIGAVLDSG